MITKIGVTFPEDWQYGLQEIEIFNKTAHQIEKKFFESNNLLINTTWFGSQFQTGEWEKLQNLFGKQKFDNLFLLGCIDPLYLTDEDLSLITISLDIKKIYYIGMFDQSPYEWNFHAIVGENLMPKYDNNQVMLKQYDKDFLCYQRKPRPWRVDFTELVFKNNLQHNGIMTLGGQSQGDYDWSEGRTWEPITLNESHEPYNNDGQNLQTNFGGIPNDLVTIGRLDIWNQCFLYISSETVFNHWEPIFVNERIWKTMIGLRPYVIQGNPKTYNWLRKNGFKTFNHYWSHINLENSVNVLENIIHLLKFLQSKSTSEKMQMYNDMIPDLLYNKLRFYEFSKEQKYKMENIF